MFVCDFIYSSSGDLPSESKQFQEMILERTKALALQADALKSKSDGKLCSSNQIANIYKSVRDAHSFDAVIYIVFRPYLSFIL